MDTVTIIVIVIAIIGYVLGFSFGLSLIKDDYELYESLSEAIKDNLLLTIVGFPIVTIVIIYIVVFALYFLWFVLIPVIVLCTIITLIVFRKDILNFINKRKENKEE